MDLVRPTEELRREEDTRLRNEAAHLEADIDLYFQSTPRERRVLKMNAVRALKRRARENGFDPEEFVDWTPEKRQESIAEATERRKQQNAPPTEDSPTVFTEGMEVPPNDLDPHRREGMTVGVIVEESDDLVGDHAPPLTLADLYARWPIGRPGGDDFYVRVERIQPKKHQELNCAGFLAKVRRPMTDEQFAKWFGGREYHLTVYGPHPRGRRDSNGDIIIKRLTAPIHVVVPHVAPNLDVMPALAPPAQQEMDMYPQEHNPFATVMPRAPTTASDANIHASSLRFFESVLKQNNEELRDARRQATTSDPTKLLSFATDMSKTQLDALKDDAHRREAILREQLTEERNERKEQEQELRELKRQMEALGVSRAGDSIEFLKFGDQSAQRQADYYKQQFETSQRSHDEQMKLLRQAHDEELKRERERLRDLEDHFKRISDDERRASSEREKALKEEVDRVRREERDNADRRVGEVEKTAQRRYDDLESAHSREMRTIKDNMEVRATAEKNRMEFELAAVRDRMEETKSEMARIREEADPIKALEKYKEGAKAFGLVEKDADAPATVWERFAQAAGGGVGQFLANADLSAIMAAIGSGAGRVQAPGGRPRPPGGRPPQLPAGQRQAPPPQQPPPQRRSRAAAWASQGSPVEKQYPVAPSGTVHTSEVPTEAPPSQAVPPQQPPPPPTPVAAPPQQQPPPTNPPPPPNIRLPPGKFHALFNDESIFVFLNRMEGAINMGFPPEGFARQFHKQFPEQSVQLAQQFQPDDAIEYVRSIPQAAGSPILRRDGKKWLEKMWPAILEVAQTSTGQPAETE
jgi:hypothetical protein